MPAIIGTTTVAANEISDNVVEGSNFEFLAVPSLVMFSALVIPATNASSVDALFTLGGTSLLQPPFGKIFNPVVFTGFDGGDKTIPNDIEHNLVRVGGDPGERIFVTFTNDNANAQTVRWSLRIDPV